MGSDRRYGVGCDTGGAMMKTDTQGFENWRRVGDVSQLRNGTRIGYQLREGAGTRVRVCSVQETGWDDDQELHWFMGNIDPEDRHPEDPFDGTAFSFFEEPRDIQIRFAPQV